MQAEGFLRGMGFLDAHVLNFGGVIYISAYQVQPNIFTVLLIGKLF